MEAVFTTVITLDSYVDGVVALSHSLQSVHSQFPFVVLCTPSTLSSQSIQRLQNTYGISRLVFVKPLPNPNHSCTTDRENAHWFGDSAFTKLRLWQLDQLGVKALVYLDPDTVVVKNIDNLLASICDVQNGYYFAASPDIFPPDKFNAGVLVLSPNSELFVEMLRVCAMFKSYDGGDTGFLNQFFPRWFCRDSWFHGFDEAGLKHRGLVQVERLPFGYNAQRIMHSWTKKKPAYWRDGVDLHVLHYSSSPKPWERPLSNNSGDLDQLWWKFFTMGGDQHNSADIVEMPRLDGSSHNDQVSFHGRTDLSELRLNLWCEDGASTLKGWIQLYERSHLRVCDPSIPRILHFIWFGPQILPESFKENIAKWEQILQLDGWEVKLWDDENVKGLPLERNDIDHSSLSAVQKSDILRLEILNRYGGVYLDCDMQPAIDELGASNLSQLTSSTKCFIGFSNTGAVEVNNGAIGCIPGHVVILKLLQAIQLNSETSGNEASRVIKTTGPGFATQVLSSLDTKLLEETETVILPADVFYPVPNSLRAISSSEDIRLLASSRTIASHQWACSWHKTIHQSAEPQMLMDMLRAATGTKSVSLENIAAFLGN
jgi:glycogenin glucosyltransferase